MGWIEDILKEVPLSAVLRERLQAADKENEQLKERVADLEKENAALRAKIPVKQEIELPDASKQILVVLFAAENIEPSDLRVPDLAEVLKMERGPLRYHLDRLIEANLIRRIRDYDTEEDHYSLTDRGRRFVVENNLVRTTPPLPQP
jgi:DNA-binding MarR family transcriptional regulator